MVRVAILNYGVGNLHSIRHGLERVGARVVITDEPEEIERADALVLPGVGALEGAIERLLDKRGAIWKAASEDKPLLGICLGLQLLFDRSEEGNSRGLGLMRGEVVRLPHELKVPHMGWNCLRVRRSHPIVRDVPSGSYVYFMHSYYVRPEDQNAVVATTSYGPEFPSVVASGSIVGVQFHPERSGELGMRVLRNFVEMVGSA